MLAKNPFLTKTTLCLLPVSFCIFSLLLAAVFCHQLMFDIAFAAGSRKGSADSNTLPQPSPAKDDAVARPTHNHPAFSQRVDERSRMVARHIKDPFFSEAIVDANVLTAMRTVPRHSFVQERDLGRAYNDHPLHIGFGQTISQPYIVAYMTDALKLKGGFKVLEVGTGSGYQAAICAELVQQVFTIEIIKELADSAKARLSELGYQNISVKSGDGYFGWPSEAPFDAIIVTAAAGLVPPPLVKQLKPGGKMILPLGSPFGAQTLVLITKDQKGAIRSRNLLPVRFVPMVGRAAEAKGN